ncbi:hypothetical protein GGR51DRAFT_561722 [Nemania sp. FL0031]|nr:hypothetical protein GGR51DRAFT_561722 [Nemania sp. FL0031]
MSGASSRKRRADTLDSPAVLANMPLLPLLTILILQSRSSSKHQRSNGPNKPKSKDALELLEKPIYVKELDEYHSLLPRDIKSLYTDLQRTRRIEGVIPSEVRAQVPEMVGAAEARPFCFREEPTPGAEALHAVLCDIKLSRPRTPSRHIPSQAPAKEDAQPKAEPQTSVNVRMVPTMSAVIWDEYISAKALKTARFWDAGAANSETGFHSSSRNSNSQLRGHPLSEDPGTEQGFSGMDLYN